MVLPALEQNQESSVPIGTELKGETVMRKAVMAVLCIVVLQGCATTALILPDQQAQVRSKLPAIEQNEAQVCFIRDSSIVAAVWKPDIKEGDKIIGVLRNGSYFCHNTNAGQHKYIASTSLDFNREVDIALNSNSRSYIRYSINMGILSGNGRLEEIDEPMGLSKIYAIDN